MSYEVCFDSRRGSGNDVNCFFFLVKIAGDGTRWKLEIEYTLWLVFSLFCVWVWSCMHQMSKLRVRFLFLGDWLIIILDPDVFLKGEVNFLWVSWISLSRRFF